MGFAGFPHSRVPQFADPAGDKLDYRRRVHGSLVCECNRLDAHRLNFLQQRFLLWREMVPIGP